ncbi:MAG: UDP-2,4-diacetamido-2,4,6-trideoxy-beta-L-altropyranose hydrolase, partial [Rhodanobacteraceae bacterium]
MNIVFRADASLDIGTGHVMRSLTLAAALREQGAQCRFVCREHPGNLISRVRQDRFAVTALPMGFALKGASRDGWLLPEHAAWLGADWQADAEATRAELETSPPDWLVVDHYGLDSRWERRVRPACKRLMAIDDLADRAHDCDLLLDQTLGRDEGDYAALVPKHCQLCVGPRYALLRPEFAALRTASLRRRVTPARRNLLVAMGGVDRLNATGRVLAALPRCDLPPDCDIIVVMG